jgi:hypothetical protein
MPATTEFSRSNKVSKLVGYLPIEEAVKLWSMTTSVASVIQLYQLSVLSTRRHLLLCALTATRLWIVYGIHLPLPLRVKASIVMVANDWRIL